MRRLVVAVLAVTMLDSGAYATAPGTFDQPCSHRAVRDVQPDASPTGWLGPLQGGPIAQNGTLRCTIKLNISTHATTTPYDIWRAATGTSGSTTLSPAVMTYEKDLGDVAYLCTEFHDGTQTWYYDAVVPSWSTSPANRCLPV